MARPSVEGQRRARGAQGGAYDVAGCYPGVMSRTTPMATTIPKAAKAHAGRTAAAATPLVIRTSIDLDDALRDDVRRRLARKLGAQAHHVERVSVRFDDLNGPKGGIDTVCRITAALTGHPSIVVEERAAEAALAFRRAADVVGRTLRRALRNAGPAARKARAKRAPARSGAPGRDDEGSLIGRRVGRASANLERALERPEKRRRDVFVDTAQPGTSATDRRAGYGATAARNTKRNTAGMQAALEDSRTTPSRKSTRRSVNRAKAATPKQRTTQLALHDPGPRARRATVSKGRPRGVP